MTAAPAHDAIRATVGSPDRIRGIDARPVLWRVMVALTAAALAMVLFFAAPGSVQVMRYAPAGGALSSSAWAAPCLSNEYVPLGIAQIGFCARADGRVIAAFVNSAGETHVLVSGGLHFTLVELKRGMRAPSWGSRIVAVGPMATTDGLRELHAITLVTQ